MSRCVACDKILTDFALILDEKQEFCEKCYKVYLDTLGEFDERQNDES